MDLDILVEKFQQKDLKAFEKLYELYSDSMFGVIYSIVRDQQVAEEVLQDVFFKAWQNADTYSTKKGRIFTWLLNISRNAAIDRTRSKAYKNSKENLNGSIFVDVVETHDKVDTTMDINFIKKVLHKLQDTCITLIELLYFKGYTQKEVSEELNIPVGTVKTNNRRCISELRKLVRD